MMPADRTRGPEPARGSSGRLLAFLDYDGTITTGECNEIMLQDLVGDAWRQFEDEVKAGRMGHAECFDRQIQLIRAPRKEYLGALLAAAQPAPGVGEFLRAVHAARGRAFVASAGFREVIQAFWRREDLPLTQIYASELIDEGPPDTGPYRLAVNPAFGDCPRCGPASCKGGLLRKLRRPGDVVWVFGDGLSDVCPAREADLVWARGRLAEVCRREGLPWRPLDFEAALRELRALAPHRRPAGEHPAGEHR